MLRSTDVVLAARMARNPEVARAYGIRPHHRVVNLLIPLLIALALATTILTAVFWPAEHPAHVVAR